MSKTLTSSATSWASATWYVCVFGPVTSGLVVPCTQLVGSQQQLPAGDATLIAVVALLACQVDLRSEFERSEDPASPLVEDAELRVSKRQGSIAQVSSVLVCAWLEHVAITAPKGSGGSSMSFPCIMPCGVVSPFLFFCFVQMERFEKRDKQHQDSADAPLIIHHLSLLERCVSRHSAAGCENASCKSPRSCYSSSANMMPACIALHVNTMNN